MDLPEEDIDPVLVFLEKEDYISRQDGILLIRKEHEIDQKVEEDVNVGDRVEKSDNGDLEVKNQLSDTEQQSLEIIRKLVDDELSLIHISLS